MTLPFDARLVKDR